MDKRDRFESYRHCAPIAKKVAALLAENAVTIREIKMIFDLVEHELTVQHFCSEEDQAHQDPEVSD